MTHDEFIAWVNSPWRGDSEDVLPRDPQRMWEQAGALHCEARRGANVLRIAAYGRLVRLQMAAYYAADRLALAEGRRRMDADH